MTDYKKLVEALRGMDIVDSCPCEYYMMCEDSDCVLVQAADAIEKLVTLYEKAEIDATNLTGKLTQAEAQLTDYAAAIEELQDKVFELEEQLNDADIAADDNGRQIKEMAKRNAELHAELEKWVSASEKAGEPKRGKWILCGPVGWPKWKCSVCYSEGRGDYRRCPWCGAVMDESNASNALNALDNAQDGPIITPCLGCSDYDGYGGCKSKGGCARAKMEVQDESVF